MSAVTDKDDPARLEMRNMNSVELDRNSLETRAVRPEREAALKDGSRPSVKPGRNLGAGRLPYHGI